MQDPPDRIIIVTKTVTARLEYVLQHISRLTGWSFQMTDSLEKAHDLPSITYGQKMEGLPYMAQSHPDLLSLQDISSSLWVSASRRKQAWSTKDDFIDLDIFSAGFYHLSRLEEYIVSVKDLYGRFLSENLSQENRSTLLDPVLDQWIKEWINRMRSIFPKLSAPEYAFKVQASFDIDYPYLIKYGTPAIKIKKLGGLIKRGAWAQILQVFNGKDPFDTFDRILKDAKEYELSPLFFLLTGDKRRKEDQTLSIDHPAYQHLIKRLSSVGQVAWHPSMSSGSEHESLFAERQLIERSCPGASGKVRFHYLKLDYPSRYQAIEQIGVRDDYSMGFADHIGFRAATAHTFYFYDFTEERTTQLLIHPLQLMDASLRYYMNLSPEQAIEEIQVFIERVRETGGEINWLWHNSSLGPIFGWQDWDKVYRTLLELS